MPLDVVRLRDSDLAALESPEACWAAVLLWCASWHQIPAASLPNDDRVLANLSGFGRVVKEWLKVKNGALRGWVLCDDGRFYHPVIAEKALSALESKYKQEWRTEIARIKKHNQRHPLERLSEPEFEYWMSLRTNKDCPQGQDSFVPDMSQGNQHPTEQNRTDTTKLSNSSEENNLPSTGDSPPTLKGEICKSLIGLGLPPFNASNPTFLKLVETGATVEEFVDTANEIKRKSPTKFNFDYLINTISGRRRDAALAEIVPPVQKAQRPWFLSGNAIEQRAKELGVFKSDIPFPHIKARVFQLDGITEDMVRKAEIDWKDKAA
jgi:hypothetical protein